MIHKLAYKVLIYHQLFLFLACSRDGTAKLWNCGRGECDSTLISCGSVINGCCLRSNDSTAATDNGSSNGIDVIFIFLESEENLLFIINEMFRIAWTSEKFISLQHKYLSLSLN